VRAQSSWATTLKVPQNDGLPVLLQNRSVQAAMLTQLYGTPKKPQPSMALLCTVELTTHPTMDGS
jgi:hypothetical protein